MRRAPELETSGAARAVPLKEKLSTLGRNRSNSGQCGRHKRVRRLQVASAVPCYTLPKKLSNSFCAFHIAPNFFGSSPGYAAWSSIRPGRPGQAFPRSASSAGGGSHSTLRVLVSQEAKNYQVRNRRRRLFEPTRMRASAISPARQYPTENPKMSIDNRRRTPFLHVIQ